MVLHLRITQQAHLRGTMVMDTLQKEVDKLIEIDSQLIEYLQKQVAKLEASRDFYKSRCELLQKTQKYMRNPERIIVCDILANNTLLPDPEGKRYGKDLKNLIGELE